MRKLLIAGNWKMNMRRETARALASAVAAGAADVAHVDLLICPTNLHLCDVVAAVGDAAVAVGAQNLYPAADGAFTGEINAAMLKDCGARYVILGHSERRHILGETSGEVSVKAKAALDEGLIPIVCVGEKLEEREAGSTADVIREQFMGSLADVSGDEITRVVLAYEPVWAIGTGKVATPDQAEEVHADLRKLIGERYNAAAAEAVRILYGGSVKPDNAADLLGREPIDGALIGGASLKAGDFLAIAAAGR